MNRGEGGILPPGIEIGGNEGGGGVIPPPGVEIEVKEVKEGPFLLLALELR